MASKADTICTDLTERIARYRLRYKGEFPKNIPVTLDELAWLSDSLYGGWHGVFVPTEFRGVPLRMVEEVIEQPNGALVVRP